MNRTHLWSGAAALAVSALMLAGCGGDGNSDDPGSTVNPTQTGKLNFFMTDAPVLEADMVVIAMTEFEFKPVEGPSFRVPVTEEGRELNLLDFTNGEKALIIDGEEVPAGDYEWLRIFFDMEKSYVRLEADGATYPLFMPSGAQTGYKLVSGFTVPVNRPVSYILDFDLRKSLISPPGLGGPFGEPRTFLLKPAIRIMNVEEAGGVWGLVDPALLAESEGNAEAACPVGLAGDVVYAFEGHDVAPLDAPPLITDIVDFNEATGEWEYHFMFLLPGDYTLAFTCRGAADDGNNETYPPAGLEFSEAINVTVVSGEVKQCNIPPDYLEVLPLEDGDAC
jgi:hypothetical protein